jgi:hypothetical protein
VHVRLAPLVIAALVLAASGCSSDDDAPSGETGTRVDASSAVNANDVSLAEKPPTEEEIRWVATLETWWVGVRKPMGAAAAAAPILARGRTLGPAATEDLRRSLRQVVRCSERFERRVGNAPSARLADVAEVVREACRKYEEGARAGFLALRGGGRTSLEEWASDWATGARLTESARYAFADYTPSNQQKLPRRSGITDVSRIEPVFSRAAQRALVGEAAPWATSRSLEVRCWSKEDWRPLLRRTNALYPVTRLPADTLGYQDLVGDYRINLSAAVCEALVDFRYRRARPDGIEQLELARAVQTLAHEAQHARGVVREAVAECYGAQRVRRLARALGADAAYADALADTYWWHVYPGAPRAYWSPDCYDGGALDLAPRATVWP